MKKKIYRVALTNYGGEDWVELYHKKKNAEKRFHKLCKEGEQYDEYKKDGDSCSWFDSGINEYSTYIDFDECSLASLFYDEE